MKINRFYIVIASALLAMLPLGGLASTSKAEIQENPGFLDLESIITGAEQFITSEIYLQNYILRMIARVTQNSEPDFANMLSAIQLIRVLEFQFDSEGAKLALDQADKLLSHMGERNWDTLVRNRTERSNVNIAIQTDRGERIHALAIVSWDDAKMNIVNIVGDIDLEMLTRLGRQFNIDELKDYDGDDN